MLTCTICNNEFSRTSTWTRWNLNFCSKKCLQIKLQPELIKMKEEEEKQKKAAKNQQGSFSGSSGGMC
jgi:hypothetical protein